jgi:hypothetical protein
MATLFTFVQKIKTITPYALRPTEGKIKGRDEIMIGLLLG